MEKFIESLPKTETHLHIEGAIPWELFVERFPVNFQRFQNFADLVTDTIILLSLRGILIDHALRIIQGTIGLHHEVARRFSKNTRPECTLCGTELSCWHYRVFTDAGKEIIDAIRSAVPPSMEVRIFMGMSRNSYSDYLGAYLGGCRGQLGRLHGIDLHGPENSAYFGWVPRLWQVARANGRILKAHAGEFGPAENVDGQCPTGVKRIQHGIHASKDKEVMKLLAGEGVTLDICPISNYKLRVFDQWENYPVREFLDRGIPLHHKHG
jgi:hypothetical protein